MPLTLDPRSQLARNFKDSLTSADMMDLMPGPMGMAARMSKPAVDVLSRWIRRFRKDKPPTVPLKNIEKALKNEGIRRGLGSPPRSWEHSAERLYGSPSIQTRRFEPTARSETGMPPDFSGADRYIGLKEKPEFDRLHDFINFLKDIHKPTGYEHW